MRSSFRKFGRTSDLRILLQSRDNFISSRIRLSKIELPSFSGNSEDWYAFYHTFEKLINRNSDLSEIQKFHYLRLSLKSEAAEVIKAFEITTENYIEAWELLVERYDNRRRRAMLSRCLICQLCQRRITYNYALYTMMCVSTYGLRALERPVDTWDDLIIHLVISKLDTITKREWKTSRLDSSIPNFKQLKDFLLQRCLALEAMVGSKN